MTTLTINLDENLKTEVQKKVKKDGFTVTALVSQFFKSYLQNEWELKLSQKTEVLEVHKEALKLIKENKAELYNTAQDMTEKILSE